ncbi:MAG: DUF1593 domain-containing protein [Bacteroidetes bacterium]|nr:DUF1593 domain-containing protein [Bacteroidota bacterium]
MKHILYAILCILLAHPLLGQSQHARLIVLSDIEAEVDDTESFIRLLLYSDEIDISGMIATTSVWKRTSVAPGSIVDLINAYRQVRPNLLKHSPAYPDADSLLQKVKHGLPVYGMQGVGEGKDSEGSDWIIKELDKDDDRPLWITVWGGSNTLAQALYKIKHTRPPAAARRLVSKLRVYTISDQDDSGLWIRNSFPDLFYIVDPGDNYGTATWSAINSFIPGISNETISNTWIAHHIQQGHGPLGAKYPDVQWGMEGDTPSWLALIGNGLSVPEHPEWGGWGGRYELSQPGRPAPGVSGIPTGPESRPIWTSTTDNYAPILPNEYGRAVKTDTVTYSGNKPTLWRWRDDFQNDFAARMDWCVRPYPEANHPPHPSLNTPEEITVRSGEDISLDAAASTDPDGDHLSFLWFSYPEAGSWKHPLIRTTENTHKLYLVAPSVTKKETAHIILQVSDSGIPRLARYKRIILTILPGPHLPTLK